MATHGMSDKMMELVARRFRTLGEPFRLRLLQQLQQGEKTVGELVEALDAGQPNISKHLGILYDAGLVGRRREGNSMVYGISDPMVFALCDLVTVVNLARTLEQLKEKGYWIVGTAMDGEPVERVTATSYDKVVLVLGNEESGLSQGIRKLCDRLASIPAPGNTLESLNVSVAAGIFLYAFH